MSYPLSLSHYGIKTISLVSVSGKKNSNQITDHHDISHPTEDRFLASLAHSFFQKELPASISIEPAVMNSRGNNAPYRHLVKEGIFWEISKVGVMTQS